jgi:hypothetical protein
MVDRRLPVSPFSIRHRLPGQLSLQHKPVNASLFVFTLYSEKRGYIDTVAIFLDLWIATGLRG